MNEFMFKNAINITALYAKMDDFIYKKHSHQDYAIGVTLKGMQYYHLHGTTQLSHPNGVMFFNPEDSHDGMAYNNQQLEYIMLYISPELLMEVSTLKQLIQFQNPIVYNKVIEQNVLCLATAIFKEQSDAICYEHLQALTDSLNTGTTFEHVAKDNSKLKLAKELIKNEHMEKFKLEKISDTLNMSKFQFIRFFKQQMGITPYQYYINYKVEWAKRILVTYKDVYWAVSECGFVDLAHLNKCFKYRYGVTAYQFMSKLK
ncbi:AraC family transcriptional regulator [Staphylococcus casei]|uniref:AraC family transcriptional regulator n=1 Tax=Staphylococcus casei TaxID=201828 RepID=A0ABZ2WEQ5_9STAP|nr:AraC family transcriptional regulator [Staphylococcus succinus]PTI39565.1 AraC family transcriptional regulator [Staphylococcus succinus]